MGVISTLGSYFQAKAELTALHHERSALFKDRCQKAEAYTMDWMTEKHPEVLVPTESGANIGIYLAFRSQVAEVALYDCLRIEAGHPLKAEIDRHQFATKRLRYQTKTQLREDFNALNPLNRLKPRFST